MLEKKGVSFPSVCLWKKMRRNRNFVEETLNDKRGAEVSKSVVEGRQVKFGQTLFVGKRNSNIVVEARFGETSLDCFKALDVVLLVR